MNDEYINQPYNNGQIFVKTGYLQHIVIHLIILLSMQVLTSHTDT